MGCFGDMTPVKQVGTSSTSTTSPPDWVQNAGQSNYDLATQILGRGFQPYGGELTAPLSANERSASDLVAKTAANPNPYTSTTEARLNGAGTAPAFKYDFSSVVDPNSQIGSISSYMDPYLASVLAPQLRDIALAGSQARQGINANATSAGAFGDARHGIVESQQRKNEGQLVADTTGQALSGAYNTGMGLREQDLQRLFGTQQAQQSANESQLARMRQSGIDLTGLDQYNTGRAINLAGALGQTGATERGVQQGADTANYNEFLRKNNFTNDEIAYLTALLSGTPTAKTTTANQTQTTSQPDNSGWQAVGSVAGSVASSLAPALLGFL